MKQFNKSPLWDSILEKEIFKEIDINTFKEEGANTRITQYSHQTHGLLFLKNILFQMANKFKNDEIFQLRKIPNRQIGGGVVICYQEMFVDLDYLMALEEVLFLQNQLNSTRSVLEIGAGYGRTCHSILSIHSSIAEYHIIDLPQMLELSRSYLKAVVTKQNFEKIRFIDVRDISEDGYDLIINIDSMQEMDQKTAESYLEYIDRCGKAFYCKNTVGKFAPDLCGWEKSEASDLAMNSGLLKESLNIFCPEELQMAQEKFLSKFIPGKKWLVEKHAVTLPWSHYYQALFVKNA